jgi:hypothetical protein
VSNDVYSNMFMNDCQVKCNGKIVQCHEHDIFTLKDYCKTRKILNQGNQHSIQDTNQIFFKYNCYNYHCPLCAELKE